MISRALLLLLTGFTGSVHAAPANDHFANRTPISAALPVALEQSTLDATLETGEPDPFLLGGASVWYTWTAPTTGYFSLNTKGSDYDTIAYVFTGNNLADLSFVIGSDDFEGSTSRCLFEAEAGTTYQFAIHGYYRSSGQLKLTLQNILPTSNDHFADSAALPSALPFTVSGSNFQATEEPGEPELPYHGASVWYHWTAPASGPVAISVADSEISCSIQGFTGSTLTNLIPIAGVEENQSGGPSRIRFEAQAGTTYRFVVLGYENSNGDAQQGDLTVSMESAPRPANDNFANAVTLTGSLPQALDFSNIYASLEPSEPVEGPYSGSSIWYRWTATANGPVALSANVSFSGWVSAYEGSQLSALTVIASGSGGPFQPMSAANNVGDDNGRGNIRIRFQATAGTTYHFSIRGNYLEDGTGDLELSSALPPGNDAFVNAVALPTAVSAFPFSNLDATVEENEPDSYERGGASIWYLWTAPSTGLHKIEATSTGNSRLSPLVYVYTGTQLNALTEVARSDDRDWERNTALVDATQGVTYRIALHGAYRSSGRGALDISPASRPDNDHLANARLLPSQAPLSIPGTARFSTMEADEPMPLGSVRASVWFRWTPPTSGSYTIINDSPEFSTVITAYTGNTMTSLVPAAGPGYVHNWSEYTFDAQAGVSYLICFQSYYGTNDYQLNISPIPRPANDLFANRTVIHTLPATIQGNNHDATLEDNEPLQYNDLHASVWYEWTAPQARIYRLTQPSFSFNAYVNIFAGSTLAEISGATGIADFWNGGDAIYLLASAGTSYQIQIASSTIQTGNFSFVFSEDNTPDITGGPLAFGTTAVGKISTGGEADEWTFTGSAGQSIALLTRSSSTLPYLKNIDLEIIDPDGNIITTAANGASAQLDVLNVPLQRSGGYRIRIKGASSTDYKSLGTYQLTLWDATTHTRAIHLDWQLGLSGTIRSAYAKDAWTFEGTAGQRIKFDHLNSPSGTYFTLTGPNGWIAFQEISNDRDGIILPTTGSYTLTVSAASAGTAPYSFRFEVLKMVDLVARCRLTGVVMPDGVFTDSSGITVSLFSGSNVVPTATQTGAINLVMNGSLSAGVWSTTGLLKDLPGTPADLPWGGGQAVVIDTEFSIPFKAQVGESRFHLTLSMSGRRVKMYFSDAHVPQMPIGMVAPANRGLHLLGIEAVGDTPATCEFTPENTRLRIHASNGISYIERSTPLSTLQEDSAYVQNGGDSTATFLGGTRARLQAFTYMDWTIFNGSNSALLDGTWNIGTLGEYLPNLIVKEQPRPISTKKTPLGSEVTLGIISPLGERIEIQSSNDLVTWQTILTGTTKAGASSIPLGSFSESAKYFRVVYPDR